MSTATPSLNDERLTHRAVRGSNRAFEAIFERYHRELYRYCAAIVGNSADAQDAVQNTMVKVLQALPGEERRIELKPWLYRIAHNEAIEIVRRRRPTEQIDADSLLGVINSAEQAEVRDRLWRLVADVAELPERQRGALVMRELGGLGFEEIGAALGTSAATARQTLYEARLGLRAMSEGREMDCAEAMRAISDGDRRLFRGRKLRAHLRTCESCRAFRAEIEGRRADLALLAPLPAVASAGILHGVLGGAGSAASAAGAAAGGGASAAGVGAAAGKSLLSAAAIKSAAAVGVVVAIGVTAADRGGLIDLGSGHSETPPPAKSAPPGPGGAGADASAASSGSSVGAGVRSGGASTSPRAAAKRDLATGRPAAVAPRLGHGSPRPDEVAPVTETPPAHTDNGLHLGQFKDPEHGGGRDEHAAAPDGKSAAAPGHTKPAGSKAAEPKTAKPAHTKPAGSKPAPKPKHEPAPKAPPGQTKKSLPPPAADAPTAEPTDVAQPAQSEAPEPVTEAHGKAATEPSTP